VKNEAINYLQAYIAALKQTRPIFLK